MIKRPEKIWCNAFGPAPFLWYRQPHIFVPSKKEPTFMYARGEKDNYDKDGGTGLPFRIGLGRWADSVYFMSSNKADVETFCKVSRTFLKTIVSDSKEKIEEYAFTKSSPYIFSNRVRIAFRSTFIESGECLKAVKMALKNENR